MFVLENRVYRGFYAQNTRMLAHMIKLPITEPRPFFRTYPPLENTQKKTRKLVKRAYFEVLQKNPKNMPRVVFDEESKTGPGFEMEHR